jgi:Tfp pilus assembly protein PilE
MLPIIPILAIAAIIGGVATLSWYSSLSRAEQNQANSMAMRWFGKRFEELAEHQQKQIRDNMNT